MISEQEKVNGREREGVGEGANLEYLKLSPIDQAKGISVPWEGKRVSEGKKRVAANKVPQLPQGGAKQQMK